MLEFRTNAGLYLVIVLVGIVVLIALIIGLAKFMNGFSRELRHLNNEIGRTRGAERSYWIRQKRRLWLSLIPFVKY